MGPVYHALGVQVSVIQSGAGRPDEASFLYDPDYTSDDDRYQYLRPITRREAYRADITYGTNNEFGFDYLRDNMVIDLNQCTQRELHLRDRRRGGQHPHRRSAHAAHHLRSGGGILRTLPSLCAGIVPRLHRETDYEVDERTSDRRS